MAGNWIKMSTDLRTNPHVVRISSALKADRLRVIGALWAVWSVFDTHSHDGQLDGYDFHAMDEEIGWPGFSDAMASVGWLAVADTGSLLAPRYDEHNGATAKRRAQEAVRKASARNADDKRTEPGDVSASGADKKRTREEKNREDKKNPLKPPKGAAARFEEFWTAWPKSERKQDKAKCAGKWAGSGLDAIADEILADVRAKRATAKWQERKPNGGDFIESPEVYLNNRRWEDGAGSGESEAAADQQTFV